MPLFEIETESHIVITWADDEGCGAGRGGRQLPDGDAGTDNEASSRHLGDFEGCLGHLWQDGSLHDRPRLSRSSGG